MSDGKERVLGSQVEGSPSEQLLRDYTNNSAHVIGLATNGVLQSAGTYNSTSVLGYRVLVQGSVNWSITLKNGSSLTIPFAAMIVGDILPENLVSITVGTGGQALLYIPS